MKMVGHVVYSINVQDLQNVAHQELSRGLTKTEIQAVEHKLGDFIDWCSAIEAAIHCGLRANKTSSRPETPKNGIRQ